MNRRTFLQSALAAPPARALAQQGRPPNVVFILADDLGWGDLGCYGHPNIKTPNLDRLARQGTQFTQFYVSGPVCSPSRCGFMAGRFPSRERIYTAIGMAGRQEELAQAEFLNPSVPTVTRMLKSAGYATAHFGKWHLGAGKEAAELGAFGIDVHRTVNGKGPGWDEQGDPYFRARSSALIVDETIRFVEQNRERPFYVNVWSLVPHATLNPTEQQMEPYQRFGPVGVPHKGAAQIFYASVTDLDTQVGRLLKRLEELRLAENTLVLFSSDNGPEEIAIRNANHSGVGSPGPFRGRKRSLYEGGVRLPLIARWPGRVPAGKVDDSSVVTAVDFMPSLARICGAQLPSGYIADGEDASDVLQGARRARGKPLFWEWRYRIQGHVLNQSPMLAMREANWKLLMNPDRSRVELYDIPRDPSEMSNEAPRRPEIVARMSEKLLAWQKTLPAGPVVPSAGKNDYPWPRERN